jgi:hypothetical protein
MILLDQVQNIRSIRLLNLFIHERYDLIHRSFTASFGEFYHQGIVFNADHLALLNISQPNILYQKSASLSMKIPF